MRVFFEGVETNSEPRQQPWDVSKFNPEHRYYNFRKHPELISQVLEDYKELSHYKSVQAFYDLLHWLNRSASIFETNDARLKKLLQNKQRDLANKNCVREGALAFFFRDLKLNLSLDSRYWDEKHQNFEVDYARPSPNEVLIWAVNRCVQLLQRIERDEDIDCIGLSLSPAYYTEAPVSAPERYGQQIVFRFWMWGDNDDEVMGNFEKTVAAIRQCLKLIGNETLQYLKKQRRK